MQTVYNPFPALANADTMLLITYRRSGTPVETPVAFAQVGARLYVAAPRDAGKVARLRATGRATVAPCTATGRLLGPKYAVEGRVLEPAEVVAAEAALRAKYPFRPLRVGDEARVILELQSCGAQLMAQAA